MPVTRFPACAATRSHEVLRQQQDVAAAGAQRRQLDVDHVDAVVEVLAKAAFLDRGFEIAIGGGDDADVERHLGVPADRPDRPLLEGAQQLGLQPEREVADLVEEERAAVGLDEESGAGAARVGEGAAGVAEELALEQRLGHGRAVDRDEGPALRRPRRWSARATSSLPVPLSPVMSTDASVSATRSSRS